MIRRESPRERLCDLGLLTHELQEAMARKGPDHPDYAIHAAHLRQARLDRQALLTGLGKAASSSQENIPFTFRRAM